MRVWVKEKKLKKWVSKHQNAIIVVAYIVIIATWFALTYLGWMR